MGQLAWYMYFDKNLSEKEKKNAFRFSIIKGPHFYY